MSSQLLVSAMLALGIGLNFFREILVSYLYGASHEVDVFRVVSFVPYFVLQTLLNTFSALYLPKMQCHSQEDLMASVVVTSIAVSAIGLIASLLFVGELLPTVDVGLNPEVIVFFGLAWLVFIPSGYVIIGKIVLLYLGKPVHVAAFSVVNAGAFICCLVVLSYLMAPDYALVYSYVASLIVVAGYYWYATLGRIKVYAVYRGAFSVSKLTIVPFNVILLVVMCSLMLAMPRVMDRSYVAVSGAGQIAALDYAYNIFISLGMILGTALVITNSKYIAENISRAGLMYVVLKRVYPYLMIGLVLSIVVYLYAQQLVEIVYSRGAFTGDDASTTAMYLAPLMLAFLPMIVNMLLMQIVIGKVLIYTLFVSVCAKILVKYIVLYGGLIEAKYLAIGYSNVLSELAFAMICIHMLRSSRGVR